MDMALVGTIRQLWRRKLLVSLVFVLAVFAAILAAYRVSVSPPGLHKRALTVAAASSQILVDSPKSTLVNGASLGTFDALATRAKIYGQYLASLAARQEIAERARVPAESISSSGPFSAATGQFAYSSQSSEERASELLQEGAENRLVFTAQEGVPILTVDAQSASPERAVALAEASFQTLKHYVGSLEADGRPARRDVTVRELGAPEGGTLGGANNVILMALALMLVFGLGCATILVIPRFTQHWRTLDDVEQPAPAGDAPRFGDGFEDRGAAVAPARPAPGPDHDRAANGGPREPIARRAAPSR